MDELMEQTGLRKELLDTPVRRLSGGEQRRLALLRSLSISPAFLLLDEVTAGLDLISTEEVLQLLEKYKHEHNCVYLVITHDVQIASRFCDCLLYTSGVICSAFYFARIRRSGTFLCENSRI